MHEQMVPHEVLLGLAEATGRRNDPGLRQMLDHLFLMPDKDDQEIAKSLAEQFTREIRFHGRKVHPFLPSPEREALANGGGLIIGRIPNYKEVVRAPLNTHWYVAGTAGSGKTTAVEMATILAYRSGRSVVVVDPEGQFAQELAGMVRPHDLYIVDQNSYLVNIYQPPAGCTHEDWLGQFANLERECFFFRYGAENLAMKVRRAILASGQELTLPSFWQRLQEEGPKIARGSREWDSFDTVKTRTEALLNYFKALRVHRSRGLEEIMSRRFVIFDWHTLENAQSKKFLTLHLLAWLMASRAGEVDHPADTLLVFDEVSQLASTELKNQSDITEPYFDTAMRRARKKGFCIVTLDQNAAFTRPVVRGNSGVKIVLRQASGEDRRVVANDLSLTPEQAAYLNKLEPREAVVKIPDVPIPFLVELPEVQRAD